MTHYILREHSPRNRIPFNHLPTKRGSVWGGSHVVHHREDYASILDSVLEMTRDVALGNGVPFEQAIEQVCKDENWRVIPRHKKLILERLQ